MTTGPTPLRCALSVLREADQYWLAIERANENEHTVPELRVPINAGATPRDLIAEIQKNLSFLGAVQTEIFKSHGSLNDDARSAMTKAGMDAAACDAIPYHENPFEIRDWEATNLALPNLLGRASAALSRSGATHITRHFERSSRSFGALFWKVRAVWE